ncbi:MAG: 2-keto-4-pentenoate hydratase, partial [Rhodospirillales bacterium]|nr:2-keto-4-pentenoate hydratase [Rhodospirillales bacterium]
MSEQAIKSAARRIRNAWEKGKPIKPVRESLPKGDVDAAYAVQKLNTDYWVGQGRRVVGRKIGLTAKAVQTQLGVDQPDYGMLFADMCVVDGDEIPTSDVLQPRVEAEVALVLDDDLYHDQLTLLDLIDATAYALPAIEVVGS